MKDTHISPDINHGRKRDTDVGLTQYDNRIFNIDGDSTNRIIDFEGL